MSSQGLLVAQILSRMMLQPDPECVHVILIASYSYQGCFKSHHLFVEHRGMTLLVTSSWHGIAGYVIVTWYCWLRRHWCNVLTWPNLATSRAFLWNECELFYLYGMAIVSFTFRISLQCWVHYFALSVL